MLTRHFTIGAFAIFVLMLATMTLGYIPSSRMGVAPAPMRSVQSLVNSGSNIPREYRVAGAVKDKISGVGYSGFTVKVLASDTPQTVLGTALTDHEGRYEIAFDQVESFKTYAREIENVSVDLINKSGKRVKSIPEIHPNSRGDTNVDFFLFRREAVADSFCCYSVDHMGSCPSLGFSRARFKALLNQLKLSSPKSWRLKQRALEQLTQPVNSQDECAERQLTEALSELIATSDSHFVTQETETCLPSGFRKKIHKTDRFEIKYIDDPSIPLISVDPNRPSVDYELRLPNPERTSLGWLRADLPVPTYIQEIGLIAEYSLSHFLKPHLSLREPRRHPSTGLIPISVCALSAAGGTSPLLSYIMISPKNSLMQNFGTVPHEIFHRVQYRYNPTTELSGLYGVMREGGARLIEDSICDSFNRYALDARKIFNDPAQSLVHFDSRCGNSISYSAALFWKYLAEQHSLNVLPDDEPDIGIDVYRKILETMADEHGRPYDPIALRGAMAGTAKPGSFDEFYYFDAERTELSSNETCWGNYLIANFLQSFESSDTRFKYLESTEQVTWQPYSTPDAILNLAHLRVRTNEFTLDHESSTHRTVIGLPAYAARYYRIVPNSSSPPRMLRISVSTFGGLADPLIQILRFAPDGALTDISKSDRPSYIKTINVSGVSSVVVIVASRRNAGDYTITFDEVPGGPDVMITRWNSTVRTEYEVNPRNWTRNSADLMLDTNEDGVPDPAFSPGVDNKLKVRVHNRGNMSVSGVGVILYYQPAIPQLDPNGWLPVSNAANITQHITNLTLTAAGNPGDSQWSAVDWTPPQNGSNYGWCVKAIVNAPRDFNSDNKVAIGCFPRSASISINTAQP